LNFDLPFIRSQFPAFSEPSLEGFGFFENAGGSFACAPVIDRLNRFYTQTKVQPYYAFAPSIEGGELMDSARSRMASWLNVGEHEVHFGPSTTANTYVLGQALREHLQPGDEVVVTNQDHESNIGAWRRLEAAGITVREWQVDPATGELDTQGLSSCLGPRTKVVAFTQCSNIMGSLNPVRQWTDLIHAAGAIAIVDGVSYCPHGLPDVTAMGADVYLFSLYKVYGPHLGVMTMSEALNASLPNQGHYFNAAKASHRFTPAGPDHAQIAASNGVIDYFEAVYQHHFGGEAIAAEQANSVRTLLREREVQLLQPLLDFLDDHSKIQLLGSASATDRAPTVAFSVQGMPAPDVAAALSQRRLGVGSGNFYAARLLEAMHIPADVGVVRASFVHYNSEAEIAHLLASLAEIID
jgi:cysteine desulfurase family protein (TIGR01976 family)